ncbi:MAG: hypothetical protein QGG64_15140 [Candidatus Latescibacteria bacterium]|jgi:cytochrome oxidase Cu insertion factor (SCO1/SenC/PrrC family)|nr:hypothetical protein [Candidatus Latescibacterota bacterium]
MRSRRFLAKIVAFAGLFCLLSEPVGAQVPVGTALPELTVYDASGETFSLAELKGSYSVLVFGCLT